MNKKELLKKYIESNNGVLTTSDAIKNGFQRTYISLLEKENYIVKVKRGVYVLNNNSTSTDELFELQYRCKKGIYSNETALYIHNLSDRLPFEYTMTVPTGYNTKSFEFDNLRFKYLKGDLINVGVIEKEVFTKDLKVKVYNAEVTICHIIKNKRNIDIEIFVNALKKYIKLQNTDKLLLFKYAQMFKVEKELRMYLEVLE